MNELIYSSCKINFIADFKEININLTIFYKYSYGHCSKEVSAIMPSREKRVRETRAGTTTNYHGRAVTLSTVRTSKFQKDFFTRTAKKWNALPACAFPNQFNIQFFKANISYIPSHKLTW